jgi:hypothetical protein
MTLARHAVKLAVVALVLLHDFEKVDSAIIAALLIMTYGLISGRIVGESAFSATWFLTLYRLARQSPGESTVESEYESPVLTEETLARVTKKDLPYSWAEAAVSQIVTVAATVKLLYLLAGLESLFWLLIFAAILVVGWLLLELLGFLFRPTGFFARLSTRDWAGIRSLFGSIWALALVVFSLYALLREFVLTHLK